jgi:ribosome biogenesis GTPase
VIDLKKLGWNAFFEREFEPFRADGFVVGRVAVEHKDRYWILTATGEYPAEVTGKLMFGAESAADFPKVGDWVVVTIFEDEHKAIIHEVLPRKSKFARKAAGKKLGEQIVAANIDVAFVVQSLDQNFNLRRLERYLVMVHESKASPVAVLNKADLCPEPADRAAEMRKLMAGLPVVAVSAKTNFGMDSLRSLIKDGLTFAFIGSSGVGKSSLINRLVGEEVLKTAEVRETDSKGRHTTARRELIVLPGGGCLIDTPGMRELQLWHTAEGLDETFADIDRLATNCHFSDCTHTAEIKCAVLAAVASGELPKGRYQNYLKMRKELAHLESMTNKESFLERKRKEKELHRAINKLFKERKKR